MRKPPLVHIVSIVILILSVLIFFGCSLLGESDDETDKQLAFVYERELGAVYYLYSIKEDGSDLRKIRDPFAGRISVGGMDISPKGDKMVLTIYREVAYGSVGVIVSVDIKTGFVNYLTRRYSADSFGPVFVEDGSAIVFSSNMTGELNGPYDLFRMNADGSGKQKIAEIPIRFAPRVTDGYSVWFLSNETGFPGIYRVNTDGSDLRLITDYHYDFNADTNCSDGCPANVITSFKISGSGNRILFTMFNRVDRIYELFIMDSNGSGIKKIKSNISQFAISPDGEKIVYVENGNRTRSIMPNRVMLADYNGEKEKMIGRVGARFTTPEFSIEGDKIAFQDFEDLYVVDAEGNKIDRIINEYIDEINVDVDFGRIYDIAWLPMESDN